MPDDAFPSTGVPTTVTQAVIALLQDHVRPGLVIDLGGGSASLEEAVTSSGFDYTACDITDLDSVADGRPVAAVAMRGGLERVDRIEDVLTHLHSWIAPRGAALVVSAANIAHVDVASKLLTGRWDMGERADHSAADERRRHFTDESLRAAMDRAELVELARADVGAASGDRTWPRDHPTRSPGTLAGRFIRLLRRAADPYAEVTHFVRLYGRRDAADHDVAAGTAGATAGSAAPFMTVITRTMGRRASLVDTLTCLAAQTDDDFEVRLMINTPDTADRRRVDEILDAFHPSFRERVHLHTSEGAHRVTPLNEGLELAQGRYVTVLDDDDLVVADWVERFRGAADEHEGVVIRCRAVDQRVDALGDDIVATATSGFLLSYRETFDLASHLSGGQTPQGSVCFPMHALTTMRIRFDEAMIVCEDLDFLLRVAGVCGVVDTRTFGMVYRRWNDDHSSMHSVAADVWEDALRRIVERLDDEPLLMPPGSAQRLFQAAVQERQLHELGHGEESLLRRMETAERNWASLAHQLAELEQHYIDVVAERDSWKERAERIDADSPAHIARRLTQRIRRSAARPDGPVDEAHEG
jgi:hypothetical protein